MSTPEVGRLPATGKPDSTHRDGIALQAVIESERRLDELSCARLVGNVAEAVHAAQKAGQPHTLTPASVVILPDGSARIAEGAASLRYTAPERVRGGAADRRTDVFALGVLLWEVLAHERLFDGRDDDAIKQAVLTGAIRPPSELNANVPAELDAICKRALARDPADRYQSAHVMAAEIDAVLGDAGYPESNEQIAAYLAKAFGPASEPARAAAPPALPDARSVPLPSILPAASERNAAPPPGDRTNRSGTLPPPVLKPASRPIATMSSDGSGPVAAPASAAAPAPAAAPASLESSPAAPAAQAAPASPASSPAHASPAMPTSAPAIELPSLFVGPSAVAPTTKPAVAPAPLLPSTTAPFGSRALLDAPTLVEPAFKPVALPTPAPASAPTTLAAQAPGKFARTEILGAAAPTAPAGSPAMPAPVSSGPPAMPAPAAAVVPTSAAGPHPALPPSRLEAPPMQAQIAVESKLPGPHSAETKLPAPFRPHPHPPRTIANAETLATPQLPAHLAAQTGAAPPQPSNLAAQSSAPSKSGGPHGATQPKPAAPRGTTQLGMPPGITVPPSSPAAPLQTADDGAFDAEHTDPVEVVALHQPRANESGVREGRDVLAGWGWSTGSVEALDDEYADDAMRRGRRNLMIAIAGALGVVIIIAAVAFAFSGSKKSDEKREHGAVTTPTAPIASAPSQEATAPSPPAPSEPPSAQPPTPEPPTPVPANAEAARTDPGQPTSIQPPGPGAVVPPRFDSVKPEPEPAKTDSKTEPAKTEPAKAEPKPEPLKAEPWKPEPAKTEPKTEPAKAGPAKAEPPKVAVAAKAALKAEPPKTEPPKVEVKKPEPKKAPEKAAKRPPEKIAKPAPKAQPVDPYATTTERPKGDPAALYRTGLQQYAHGDTAGALATFRGSLQTNPGFAPTWRGIGLVHEKMGNKSEARAAFKRYLQLAPTAGDADQIRDRMERLGS